LPPSISIRSGSSSSLLLHAEREAAPDDLPHRREVVAGVLSGDPELAVCRLVRQAVEEAHARRDRVPALDRRDVEAVDARRRLREAQQPREPRGGLAPARLEVRRDRVGEARVVLGQLEVLAPGAALRDREIDRPTALAREPGLHDRVLGRQRGNEHLAGHVGVALVEAAEQVRDQQLVRQLARELEAPAALEPPGAEHQHDDRHARARAVDPERVLVDALAADDALPFGHRRERLDLLLLRIGDLELEPLGREAHLVAQALQHGRGAALQDLDGLVEQAVVVVALDQADARGRAAPDLVLDAGPHAVLEHAVLAVAQRHDLVQEPQRAAHRRRRRVGPEVRGAVVAPPADEAEPRPGLGTVEAQEQERLVVLELDVVGRLALLDDRVLEQQRLLLGRGREELDVGRLALEEAQLRPAVAAGLT
jgi:hypothetical protein